MKTKPFFWIGFILMIGCAILSVVLYVQYEHTDDMSKLIKCGYTAAATAICALICILFAQDDTINRLKGRHHNTDDFHFTKEKH
jgi:TRAP-type C4-dicarboxylate transport system permease small subunit